MARKARNGNESSHQPENERLREVALAHFLYAAADARLCGVSATTMIAAGNLSLGDHTNIRTPG